MDEDDIQLILKQFSSCFITYGLPPGINTIIDISEAVYAKTDHEGTLQIECDDITMKTRLILFRFGLTFGVLRFKEKLLLNTLLRFGRYWDYKPTNAIHVDSPGVYTREENLNFSPIDELRLKGDGIDGSVVNGSKQPKLYSFVGDKPPKYKVFFEPETIH